MRAVQVKYLLYLDQALVLVSRQPRQRQAQRADGFMLCRPYNTANRSTSANGNHSFPW